MSNRLELSVQMHVSGEWNNVAVLTISDTSAGWAGASRLDYETSWTLKVDPDFSEKMRGWHAVSVRNPPSLMPYHLKTWPPFLLDMLPQGHAREVLTDLLQLKKNDPASEIALLLRTAGDPIGNIRIRQAWEAEQERIDAVKIPPGISLEAMLRREDTFREFARDFAPLASGSSGVQGAWPKLLMTRNTVGEWLPSPLVPDAEATDHCMIKWPGDRREETRLILAAEDPYLELARSFGLRCARPLVYRHETLLVPRFDRKIVNGRVVRLGQESIVSAAGIAAFGHLAYHETYLDVLKSCCTNPSSEVTEYVLRDVLNLALGNPDNHGRNTALQKMEDGQIWLTPLYDFCPMRLAPEGIARSTSWKCMKPFDGAYRDLDPDWEEVCRVAAKDTPGLDSETLADILADKSELLRRMPELAQKIGVPDPVIARAMTRCGELADALEALKRRRGYAPR